MHLLVTNDDGVQAPGLLALAQALRKLGKVTVVAPDRNWSVCGHTKTLHKPLWVNEVTLKDGTPALSSDGSPSDCVALGILGLLKDAVDFVVSGINNLPNLGHDLTYSGTVTSALEGALWGRPAIAVSLDASDRPNEKKHFETAGEAAVWVVEMVLRNKLPPETALNVNVPNRPFGELKGFAITRACRRIYRDALLQHEDPRGRPYYWIGGDAPLSIAEEGTDASALAKGYVSICPVHLDLTAHNLLEPLRAWEWPEIE